MVFGGEREGSPKNLLGPRSCNNKVSIFRSALTYYYSSLVVEGRNKVGSVVSPHFTCTNKCSLQKVIN